MADVSERTLQVAVVVSFAAGFLAGWQANRMRRRFLDWRKKRLQDKLKMEGNREDTVPVNSALDEVKGGGGEEQGGEGRRRSLFKPTNPSFCLSVTCESPGSVCVLHLADRDLISTLLSRRCSLSQEEGVFGCVRMHHPPLPPPTEATPSTFVAKGSRKGLVVISRGL
ncbi:hypothetical protein INR49_026731 [Caranx melampygus]|nr:hypothetical protein INR49_026731 [Caranx melampygus]